MEFFGKACYDKKKENEEEAEMIDNAVTRVIAQRRSVRKYVQRQLTQEELDTILSPENMIKPVKLDIKPRK